MDPNNIPTPSFDLPRPAPSEAGQVPGAQPSETPQQTEQQNMEMPSVAAPAPPGQASTPGYQLPNTQQPAAATPIPSPPVAQQAINDDMTADDSDLIEKAWITKAKAIVEQTKADPHAQNKQINRVKSEYIKKRYGKDIKLSDEQAA